MVSYWLKGWIIGWIKMRYWMNITQNLEGATTTEGVILLYVGGSATINSLIHLQ